MISKKQTNLQRPPHTHTAVSRCAACILNYSNLQIVLMENWQHYLEAICFLKILSIFICHCRILTRIHRVWWGMAARTQTFTNTMQSSFHLRNFFSAFTLLWHPQHPTSHHILIRILYSGWECVIRTAVKCLTKLRELVGRRLFSKNPPIIMPS